MDYRDFEAGAHGDFFLFRAKRDLVGILFGKAVAGDENRILNVGAGTGEDMQAMADHGDVYAVDSEAEALDMIPEGVAFEKRVCDVQDLGYPDGFFDIAAAFDVLEHVEDDARAVAEIGRVLKPGGKVLITVPAFPSLISAHDRALGHFRRYKMSSLKTLFGDFEVMETGYWVFSLFPPVALQRLLAKKREPAVHYASFSRFLNGLLYRVLRCENRLIERGVRFPYGMTIYAICRKRGAV